MHDEKRRWELSNGRSSCSIYLVTKSQIKTVHSTEASLAYSGVYTTMILEKLCLLISISFDRYHPHKQYRIIKNQKRHDLKLPTSHNYTYDFSVFRSHDYITICQREIPIKTQFPPNKVSLTFNLVLVYMLDSRIIMSLVDT